MLTFSCEPILFISAICLEDFAVAAAMEVD